MRLLVSLVFGPITCDANTASHAEVRMERDATGLAGVNSSEKLQISEKYLQMFIVKSQSRYEQMLYLPSLLSISPTFSCL
jgi:hypothetical protein